MELHDSAVKEETGFTAVEMLLSLIIVVMITFVGYYIYNTQKTANATYKAASNASQVSPPKHTKKTAITPASSPDPTAAWTVSSSTKGQFSLRYPTTWVQPTHKEYCNADLFDRAVYLGPDADSVLKCGSEYFGQIAVTSVVGDKTANTAITSDNFDNILTKQVTVNGVKGTRTAGVAKAPPADATEPGGYLKGTIVVDYVFYAHGSTYAASYTQAPVGSAPSSNVLSDFDLMVTNTLKFE